MSTSRSGEFAPAGGSEINRDRGKENQRAGHNSDVIATRQTNERQHRKRKAIYRPRGRRNIVSQQNPTQPSRQRPIKQAGNKTILRLSGSFKQCAFAAGNIIGRFEKEPRIARR